jgi:hypothetical protein
MDMVDDRIFELRSGEQLLATLVEVELDFLGTFAELKQHQRLRHIVHYFWKAQNYLMETSTTTLGMNGMSVLHKRS